MSETLAIGLMSGSSLDGVDLALVRFDNRNGKYVFQIIDADTIPYPEKWKKCLSEAFLHQPEELHDTSIALGRFYGELVADFAKKNHVHPDFVASHGHTIFHKPEQHFTLQIGDGQAMADACKFKTINDFRSEDVDKGGQGAPLVPIGDKLLFGDYEACLNIGGIANVSYEERGKRIAYDICIANQALNHLAQREGLEYDRDGHLACGGHIDEALLSQLNADSFFTQPAPKSLGREFFESKQKDLLNGHSTADLLCTFTEHIAQQIGMALSGLPKGKLLITGGGAWNAFLVERIQSHTRHEVVIPSKDIVNYKEALIFAFLGLLKTEGKTNVLSSVTGAASDSSSGVVWTPHF